MANFDNQSSFMLRFTIRDLLWLMALSAALVAWYADHEKLSDAYTRVVADRDRAHLLGEGLISTMRLDGYELEGPTWDKETVVRVMSKPKPKQVSAQKASPAEN